MAESHKHRQARAEKLAFWEAHITKQRSSGLSMKAYCASHALSKGGFKYWNKHLLLSERRLVRESSPGKSPLFTEIDTSTVCGDNDSAMGIEKAFVLQLPREGYVLGFNRDVDISTLKALVSLLEDRA